MISPNRRAAGLLLSLIIALSGLAPVIAQSDDSEAVLEAQRMVEEIVERYSTDTVERAWEGCRELERIRNEEALIDWGLEALRHERAMVRLMAAKTLLALDEDRGVESTLQRLAESTGENEAIRAAALTLLGEFDSTRTIQLLEKVLGGPDAYQPRLRLAAAQALFENSNDYSTVRESLVPLLEVEDVAVRTQAALVLGEMGYVDGRIKTILRKLSKEPTTEGSRARLTLSNDLLMRRLERMEERGPAGAGNATELSRKIARLERDLDLKERKLEAVQRDYDELKATMAKDNFTHPLIGDLLDRIKARYVDPSVVDETDLIVEAAKGMVRSLDPFSSFMDPKDTQQFEEDISGKYAGIGARVTHDRETDAFIITRPVYSGPAFEAGLLSGDRIVEVGGVSTNGFTMEDLIKALKGEPNTPIELKIFRRGWREARDFSVPRRVIELPSVHWTMLPGKIGYIHLAQFGDTAISEINQALDQLLADGMKGLVLDLRNNPGGYLNAAVAVVDAFVGEMPDPIVVQKGKGNGTQPESRFATEGHRGDFPLSVLINSGSASASEIVSGALQDYDRATVIGERSFGKGSVQKLLALPEGTNNLLGGETTLRLTVQYYYLPSGRSIHTQRDREGRLVEQGGVEPDITIEIPEIPLWRLEAIDKMRDNHAFDDYLLAHFEANRETFERIAIAGDGGKTDVYPEFEAFFSARNPMRAEADDIRRELRRRIRIKVEDARGEEFACDYLDDVQLQGAILDTLTKLGQSKDDVPEYRGLER